jgi:hypothetical protein
MAWEFLAVRNVSFDWRLICLWKTLSPSDLVRQRRLHAAGWFHRSGGSSYALIDMRKHLIAIKYSLLSLKVAETVRYRVYLRPQILRSHRQLYINEVVFGTGFGVLLGPHVLNIFDPRSWTSVTNLLTREVMRIVLAIGLFAIGVRLPTRYMAEHAKSLLIMVVPTMAFGWLISAGKSPSPITRWHTPLTAFVLSVSIYPRPLPTARFCILTRDISMPDPNRPDSQCSPYRSVSKIIGRLRHLLRCSEREDGNFAENKVPLEVRQLLVAESASNDGLAYPFLSIAMYLTTESSRGTAFEKWIVIGWLCTWVIRAFG